jgi:hypothetical protein
VALDRRAAFDLVDYSILLKRLNSMFGISGTILKLIESFLTGRYFKVMCEKISSEPYPLTTGVPQGSVLGPILFTLYVAPVVSIVNKHGLYYHYYADDLLIYGPLNKSNVDETLFNISSCLEEVRWWFLTNKLVINPVKTESILVGTPQLIARHRGTVALNFAGNVITPAEH